MGINNLLRFMKPYVESVHIKKYAGKRVGIDAYSWLHKGAYSCSMELCLDIEGDKKYWFLRYFMHRINMLRHYNITPVVVFDGGSIPVKANTEDERHRRRTANRNSAMEKLKEGDSDSASELFQRAVSVTPLMARQLIQVLRSENTEYVVAPYEADAQLAYLSGLEAEQGGIDAVISEDSDLLAYGCPAVVFKMDRYGKGEEIALEKVLNSVDRVPSFRSFDRDLFTGMCVLAGCDFLPSVPGIGIAKAYNFVAKYRNIDRVLSVLKFEKGKQMPEDYLTAFKEAMAVFRHARVYDAASKQLKPLNPLTPELLQSENENLDFLGPDLSPSIAIAIAEGNLDPCTMDAFDHFLQPGHQHHPGFQLSDNRHLKEEEDEETTESTQEGCFTILPCHKTIRKRIRGDIPPTNNFEEENPKILHWGEALALEKLAFPSGNETSEEKRQVSVSFASSIPNNNPFKRRKQNQVQQLNQEVVVDGQEQASQVTEIEHSTILFTTPQSQQRLKSGQEGTRKGDKLLKQVPCNRSVSKITSILNFFSRV